jgi:hypothetical protein
VIAKRHFRRKQKVIGVPDLIFQNDVVDARELRYVNRSSNGLAAFEREFVAQRPVSSAAECDEDGLIRLTNDRGPRESRRKTFLKTTLPVLLQGFVARYVPAQSAKNAFLRLERDLVTLMEDVPILPIDAAFLGGASKGFITAAGGQEANFGDRH